MRYTGIYHIVSVVDGSRYIGSSVDLVRRFATHRWELRNGKHSNQHLQAAWDLYGERNFTFCTVEHCSKDDLLLREQKHLDQAQLDASMVLYNITFTAERPQMSAAGKEATRKRMLGNTYTLGLKRSPEACLGTKLGNTGKVRSKDAIQNYRRAAQNREAIKRAERQAIPVVAPWIKSNA